MNEGKKKKEETSISGCQTKAITSDLGTAWAADHWKLGKISWCMCLVLAVLAFPAGGRIQS